MVAKNFNLMVLMKMDPQKDGIFQGLDRKSFEILSEKSSRYPFLQNFHADDKKDSFVVVDDASNQISSLISLLNRALDTEETLSEFEGDEIISEIRRTGKKLRSVDEKWHKCDELMNELNYKYNSIADKTSSLHDACNQMLSQQTQLAAIAMQVGANLHYYQQYEWLVKKLQTPKLLLTGTLFTQILSTINESITYLKANMDQNDAALYLEKYEQCLSRALTAMKTSVLASLEQCKEDILYKNVKTDRLSAMGSPGDQQNVILSYVDDDTFTLLYGVFGMKANSIRNAFYQVHQFFADHSEYQTVVSECENEYFQIRDELLRPIVNTTIQGLCQRHKSSSCSLCRDGCTFLLRLCDDEYRLYKQFFVVDLEDGTRSTRSITSPSSPTSFLQSVWQASIGFDTFVEGLCRIFYDTLRPMIIHNSHLETLAQMCTLLKVEMIEERCGASIVSPPAALVTNSPTSHLEQFFSVKNDPRAGFVKVMGECVADIVERIIYRTTLFAKSDILEYNPVQGDLMYPERLLMMRNIKNQSVRSDSTQENPSTEEDVNNGRTRISSVSSLVGKSTMSSSPIDHHCLWFPTVRRTVMCLSKLYKCLDETVFVSVSRELLDACCKSLEVAVERIRKLPIDQNSATIKGCGNRTIDSDLFIVKHLLIIREQTSPYRQVQRSKKHSQTSLATKGRTGGVLTPQYEYSLDFSKYPQSMLQLLSVENRARWFEFGSNNALLSLFLMAPVNISELQTDPRRIIEMQLKRWCQRFIEHITELLIGPILKLNSQLESQPEEKQKLDLDKMLGPKVINDRSGSAFKNLKQNWPSVRKALSLYIGVQETEEILLQPIRKEVLTSFNKINSFVTNNFDEEHRQVASIPSQEQIHLILNTRQNDMAVETNK